MCGSVHVGIKNFYVYIYTSARHTYIYASQNPLKLSNLTLARSGGQEGGREAGTVHGLAAGGVVLVVGAADHRARLPRRHGTTGRAVTASSRARVSPFLLLWSAATHAGAPDPPVLAAALVAITDGRHFSVE